MVTSSGLVESKLEAIAPLDDGERARLKELEAIVEQGLQTFYEVGKALEEIRDQRLYRETHKTFEAYCQNRWSLARRTAYQYISGAQVVENLCAIAHIIPKKENQVRPLTQLPPELQLQVWQEAVELAPNGVPTGALVKRLVEERLSRGTERHATRETVPELQQLRSENQRLKLQIREQNLERERRAAEVATELEGLRVENKQLRAELRQRDRDWEVRIGIEQEKIRSEINAEYQGQIKTLTQQLTDMTTKYEAVLARLEAIERGNK
jgi:hypothetical protein